MKININSIDRRRFIRGAGLALALPAFETFPRIAGAADKPASLRRLACFYLPNGVPMPRRDDPAYEAGAGFRKAHGRITNSVNVSIRWNPCATS